jgi:hypothetical protein
LKFNLVKLKLNHDATKDLKTSSLIVQKWQDWAAADVLVLGMM